MRCLFIFCSLIFFTSKSLSFEYLNSENLNISVAGFIHFNGDEYKYKNNEYKKYNKNNIIFSYINNGYFLSYFKNSYNQNTFFIGTEYNIFNSVKYDFGFGYGLSKGYYLNKVFHKNNYIRDKLYSDYDGFDKPILPFFYSYGEYKIDNNNTFRGVLLGLNALAIIYSHNF